MQNRLRPHRRPQSIFATISVISLFLCLGLAGCVTTSADAPARFHGTNRASVVFQYNSPDYIYMTKPDYRDGGFLHQIHTSEVAHVLDDQHVPPGIAVVSLPYRLPDTMEESILRDWKSVLQRAGFRQVIFVRGTGSASVEGAVIISANDLLATADAKPTGP